MFFHLFNDVMVPRSSPRWQLIENEKRESLYLSPFYYWRLLALPCQSRTATQKPTLYIQPIHPAISQAKYLPNAKHCISKGIYRCYILDFDRNFARISSSQESARINAFLVYVHCIPPHLPLARDFSANRSAVAKVRLIFGMRNRHDGKERKTEDSTARVLQ